MSTYYNRKIIISGKHIEVYDYEFAVIKRSRKRVGRSVRADIAQNAINRKKNAHRARVAVARLINANYDLDKFLTLTFAENVCDLDFARNEFKKFIKRLNYIYKGFKYICVPEFQERGAVHFHVLCNLPFVNVDELADIWGNGFIRINRIDNVDNVGMYVTKYMTKENADDRLCERRCYTCSRNLRRVKVITKEEETNAILQDMENVVSVRSSEYNTDQNGVCSYTHFTLSCPFVYRNFWQRLTDRTKLQFTPYFGEITPFRIKL